MTASQTAPPGLQAIGGGDNLKFRRGLQTGELSSYATLPFL